MTFGMTNHVTVVGKCAASRLLLWMPCLDEGEEKTMKKVEHATIPYMVPYIQYIQTVLVLWPKMGADVVPDVRPMYSCMNLIYIAMHARLQVNLTASHGLVAWVVCSTTKKCILRYTFRTKGSHN